jgi:3-hydroxyisobutyrate dehydrogenase-like beta-hydroxyacid dehydrogenase
MIECIGLVSPGAMGTEVGRSLGGLGSRVVVALEGRSDRSQSRAEAAGLDDVGSLSELVRASDVVLSIVPPAFALEVASQLAQVMTATGAHPLVVDANAVSPARARETAAAIERGGGRYVDGGIVGGPPRRGGRTDLVLSGDAAGSLAPELTTDELVATAIGTDPTAASALKMCYASWTKGTSALLLSIRAVARRQGVEEALIELWGRTQPTVLARSDAGGAIASRAWRWVDEMGEISRTFEDAGVPGGAATAASRLYERLASMKDVDTPPSLDELLTAILR